MFDTSVLSKTTSTGPFTVEVNTENVDYIAFMGVAATSITLELWNRGDNINGLEKTIDLVYTSNFTDTMSDWWEYFFGVYRYRTEASAEIEFLAAEALLKITFNGAVTDTVTCGVCIFGRAFDIGDSLYGAKPGYINFTKWTDNEEGVKTLKKGYSAKRMVMQLAVPTNKLDEAVRILTQDIKDTPTIFIGNSQYSTYESLITFGLCKVFDPEVSNKTHVFTTMEIEGYV